MPLAMGMRIRAPALALDFLGKTSALVATEKGHRLTPIDFPRSEQRLLTVRGS